MPLYKYINNFSVSHFAIKNKVLLLHVVINSFDVSCNFTISKNNPALVKFIYQRMFSMRLQYSRLRIK